MAVPVTNLSADFSECIDTLCTYMSELDHSKPQWFRTEQQKENGNNYIFNTDDLKAQCQQLFNTGNGNTGTIADIMSLSAQFDFIRTVERALREQYSNYSAAVRNSKAKYNGCGADLGPLRMGVQNIIETWLKHSSSGNEN